MRNEQIVPSIFYFWEMSDLRISPWNQYWQEMLILEYQDTVFCLKPAISSGFTFCRISARNKQKHSLILDLSIFL